MDKQTLSNYGWLVIVTLILAVMLALATPFGTYVGDAVVSIANGYVQASNNAIDEDNLQANGEKWDGKFDYDALLKTGATFTDGVFLTWKELQLSENGTKYGYDASKITDTELKVSAFRGCANLCEIVIPNNIEIAQMAFQQCTSLQMVLISDATTCIPEGTFYNCTSLTTIKIKSTVTSIRDSAFGGCTSLIDINFTGTMEQWNNIILKSDWNYNVPATIVHCSDGDVTI